MTIFLRSALIAAVSIGVGLGVDHALLRHAADGGLYQPQVRMGAAMGGLFAGGFAATITLLALLLARKKKL